jgi:hypothetical protein
MKKNKEYKLKIGNTIIMKVDTKNAVCTEPKKGKDEMLWDKIYIPKKRK